MELIIARHAETHDESKGDYPSPSSSLCFDGINQAIKLAGELASTKIDFLYSSTYNGATQTSFSVAQVQKTKPDRNGHYNADPRLKDLPVEQLQKLDVVRYLQELKKFYDTLREFYDSLKEKHPNNNILVVTHEVPSKVLSCLAQGKSLESHLGKVPVLKHGEFERYTI